MPGGDCAGSLVCLRRHTASAHPAPLLAGVYACTAAARGQSSRVLEKLVRGRVARARTRERGRGIRLAGNRVLHKLWP
eukprot:3500570-Alexandrium_andersonii.AAC.1